MILKLKVKYDDVENKYHPTQVFFVNDFVNFYGAKSVLSEIGDYIKSNDVSKYIQNKDEVHFRISKTEEGYVNMGVIEAKEFSLDDLVAFICKATQKTKEEIFAKSMRARQREKIVPRGVIYAAAMYFGKLGSSELMRQFGYNHATVLNSVGKTLPSCLISKIDIAVRLTEAVAERYGDTDFVQYCQTFKIGKPQEHVEGIRYKGVEKSRDKFMAVYRHKGRRKSLGTFTTRFAAAQAYENYVNNLNQ